MIFDLLAYVICGINSFSKVLVNRLKSVLTKLISWSQSAFIPGRLIIDNIMVAYELLHTMHSRKKGREGCMAIKLDMSKPYDRVEWEFLEAMLVTLGFGAHWVKLLMTCVKSVSYAVMVNGVPGKVIFPTRGLRQGDPLSPYLFLLCAEGLSNLLQQAELKGLIKGVAASRGGIKINHLLVAEDCVIFCRAKQEKLFHLIHLLHQYEIASGQALNRHLLCSAPIQGLQ